MEVILLCIGSNLGLHSLNGSLSSDGNSGLEKVLVELMRLDIVFTLVCDSQNYKFVELLFVARKLPSERLLCTGKVSSSSDASTPGLQHYDSIDLDWKLCFSEALCLYLRSRFFEESLASRRVLKFISCDFPLLPSLLLGDWTKLSLDATASNPPASNVFLAIGNIDPLLFQVPSSVLQPYQDFAARNIGTGSDQWMDFKSFLSPNSAVVSIDGLSHVDILRACLDPTSTLQAYHNAISRLPSMNTEVLQVEPPLIIQERVYARIGLMGNPSDGFYGKCISALIKNYFATATLTQNTNPHDQSIEYVPSRLSDSLFLLNQEAAVEWIGRNGYDGALRLFLASLRVFFKHCQSSRINLNSKRGFRISISTNIPRQVGLAGSSAMVVSFLKVLMKYYKIPQDETGIPSHLLANLALSVEVNELGIAAGHQDRVIQVYGGIVFMDFNKQLMLERGYGEYTRLERCLLPKIWIAYVKDPKESGKVHSDVKKRFAEGDALVVAAMKEFAGFAVECQASLEMANFKRVAELFNENFNCRRRIYGDKVIGGLNVRIMEIAARHGHAGKLSGSGGCVIGCRLDGNPYTACTDLQKEMEREGFIFAFLDFFN